MNNKEAPLLKVHHWLVKIFWLAIGIFVAIHAYQLGVGNFRSPGPGFIFFFAALFLVVLSVMDLTIAYIGRSKTDNRIDSIWAGVRWHRLLLVLMVLLAYAYFFNIWGFILPTFFLMVFLFKMLEPTKWSFAIIGSIITIITFYMLFKVWLDVPFPKGFMGY
jgi:putative tricarboxylic transport membrane protein